MELTQEELDKKIEEAVNKAKTEIEAELKKTHDSEMAQMRIKAKEELDKAVKKATEEANLSAEEKAKKVLEEKQNEEEEQRKAEHEELEKLRYEKKVRDRTDKLTKAGVPEIFGNNIDLINCEDDKVDEVIKDIKAKYESILPNGAVVSTNLKTGDDPTPDKFSQFRNEGLRK